MRTKSITCRGEKRNRKNSRPMRDDCFYWCARGDLPAVRGGGSRLWSAPGAPFTPAPVQVPGIKKKNDRP